MYNVQSLLCLLTENGSTKSQAGRLPSRQRETNSKHSLTTKSLCTHRTSVAQVCAELFLFSQARRILSFISVVVCVGNVAMEPTNDFNVRAW